MGVMYDFSGYATKNDLKCSDGRTIRKDAFKDNDGQTVPLVWQHVHNDPMNVLGHALLENRDDGVYAYCKFNDTESGKNAKILVQHGDVNALSIYANKLKQQGSDVLHGAIREVSLVLAGANPGAFIDSYSIAHADGESEFEDGIIYTGEQIYLEHSCGGDSKKKKEMEHGNDEEKIPVEDVVEEASLEDLKPASKTAKKENEESDDAVDTIEDGPSEDNELKDEKSKLKHADNSKGETAMADNNSNDKTVGEVFDSLTEEQKTVVYAMIGQALEDAGSTKEETMKHNVFDDNYDYGEEYGDVLTHADMDEIFMDAKRCGSLKESVLAHAGTYGIDDIDYLFPEARTLNNTPEFIKRDMDWVQKVMGAVHHTPFSRIKSVFADITADEARAKGYIKGNMKKEEVFSLLKRQTLPTTVYKKQKLDRDDIVDITDFDVVAWLKSEMRLMLDEELARAILIGDGRSSIDTDKIQETNIRPIMNDVDLYSYKVQITVSSTATDEDRAKAFIRAAIKSRKNYKGTGNPSLYTTEDTLTDCLLIEDAQGRRIYDDENHLATALRVKEIITIPVMEGVQRHDAVASKDRDLAGIIVNLADYNIGADKGGAVSMFDDFDIDYNQQKYLIETRCSGALTKPYSALVLEYDVI